LLRRAAAGLAQAEKAKRKQQ